MARINSLGDPRYKKRHRTAIRKAMKEPKVKARTRAAAEARWKVPGYRENQSKKQKERQRKLRLLRPPKTSVKKPWETRNCKCGKIINKQWTYKCEDCTYTYRRIKGLLEQAKIRAKRKGIPFSLKKSDIKIPKFCPVLNIPIFWGRLISRDHSPSIDRIFPNKGYTPKNIIIVSWRANNIRRNWSAAELKKVANFYAIITRTR